jgi:hypothetical protein
LEQHGGDPFKAGRAAGANPCLEGIAMKDSVFGAAARVRHRRP